jgi:hypothetical protein
MPRVALTADQRMARFWDYVEKTPTCWNWTIGLTSKGYGQFYPRQGQPRRAHRISWELTYGSIPTGMYVCHTCDNRKCVRPDHLFLGTQLDNLRDSKSKGRTARGERAASAILTTRQVQEIVRLYKPQSREFGQHGLARRYGVHQTSISSILNGYNWNHVTGFAPAQERLHGKQ